MNLWLCFLIARTHLTSRMRQTIVASLGVTFGIAMFVFMTGFMTGANKIIEDTLLTNTPHIHIYKDMQAIRSSIISERFPNQLNALSHPRPREEGQNLKDGLQILDAIRRDPAVLGVTPQVATQVFYNYGPVQINGLVSGVDIREEDKLFNISEKMIEGRMDNLLSSSNSVLIGSGLAQKMNIGMGDRITITTATGVQLLVKIVGVFKTGISQIDNTKSYANLQTVQKLLQKDKSYLTEINLKLKDLNEAKFYAAKYERQFGYKAEDWQTANAAILVSFTLRNIITYATSLTLLLVAGFGIYNILNMTIYEKMRDIAILKATGFASRDIVAIFMLEALTIGFLGGLVGLFLGFLISLGVSYIPFKSDAMISMNSLPMNFDSQYYIFGIAFALIVTAFAGYLPARKASKIDPVEIIRGQ